MKEILKMIKGKEKERMSGVMDAAISEMQQTIKWKEKEYIILKMEIDMKENL